MGSDSNYSLVYIYHNLSSYLLCKFPWKCYNALVSMENKNLIKVHYKFPWKMRINEPFLQGITKICYNRTRTWPVCLRIIARPSFQSIFGGLIRAQFEFKYPALNKPRQNIGCQNLVLKKSK